MPWYSNIGLVIAGIGALGLVYGFYQNYKKRTIPIMETIPSMEGVDMIKSHPLEDFSLTMDAIFSNQHSEHSTDTKQLILFILEQSKNGKLSLFGKKKHLSEEKISSYDIKPERLGFDQNDIPLIYNFNHKILYKELRVYKKELQNKSDQ